MSPSWVSCCAWQGHRTHCCQQGTRWLPLSEGLASFDVTSEMGEIPGLVVIPQMRPQMCPFSSSPLASQGPLPLCIHPEATDSPGPMTLSGGVQVSS